MGAKHGENTSTTVCGHPARGPFSALGRPALRVLACDGRRRRPASGQFDREPCDRDPCGSRCLDAGHGFDPQLALNGAAECFADNFNRDAVVDLLKESFHDHVHGFFL